MKVTKTINTIFLILGILFIYVEAQNESGRSRQRSIKVNKVHAANYITLERIGRPELNSSEDTQELVWLRLHNNTRWKILLEASGGNEKYEDARLYYDMLDINGNIKEAISCHVCSITKLQSGKSILFTVPYLQFTGTEAMRIRYNYDWENFEDAFTEGEPTHYIYFYTRNLGKVTSK